MKRGLRQRNRCRYTFQNAETKCLCSCAVVPRVSCRFRTSVGENTISFVCSCEESSGQLSRITWFDLLAIVFLVMQQSDRPLSRISRPCRALLLHRAPRGPESIVVCMGCGFKKICLTIVSSAVFTGSLAFFVHGCCTSENGFV